MMETNAAEAIQPAPLGATEMAQVLAALIAREDDVLALVVGIAPCSAIRIVEELGLLATGVLGQHELSPALRWILPEIHAELGRSFPATRV
jgi:hypothetical protein